MNINKELLNDLYDSSVRIDNLFNMELVTCCDNLSDTFWDMFDSNYLEVLEALNLKDKDLKEYNDLRHSDDLLDFLHDNRLCGFLIQFSTPVPRDFSFSEDGEFQACSLGWDWSMMRYVFAHTLEDALRQALEVQDAYFSECEKKARK